MSGLEILRLSLYGSPMTIRFHKRDLPDLGRFRGAVAIDTETLGLNPHRDRLCLVQLSAGDGSADIVQIAPGQTAAPNLARLLADPAIVKIFHYARFDIAVLEHAFGVMAAPLLAVEIGMGERVLITTFVVIVIGGVGSVRGALVGALLVGMVDSLGRAYLPQGLQMLLPPSVADTLSAGLVSASIYVLMAIVLLVRPLGLLPARS